jgi:magnesium-transporting ATPase (P-type)
MAVGCLMFFFRYYSQDIVAARTWVFMLLVLLEMLVIQIIRSDYGVRFWSNKWLFGSILLSIGLVFLVIYIPFFASIFQTKPLTWIMWLEFWIIMLIVIIVAIIMNKLKNLQKLKK